MEERGEGKRKMDRAIFGIVFVLIITGITFLITINKSINLYTAIRIQLLIGILALSLQIFIYKSDKLWNFILGVIK
jgi:heme/copper-type cytochrome/quinol oxidase subunit 4